MIVYLTTLAGRETIDEYLAGSGAALRDVIRPWTYDELIVRARGELPAGTYIFADIERLDPATEERAAEIWSRLQADPARWRTLNRPGRTLRRKALLEALHAAGINDFRVWSALDEPPPDARFPVFLRIADDHAGARTGLLADRAALAAELERQAARGAALEQWIACEYAAERRPEGCFVKHGAFIVDGVVAPRHLMFGSDWVVKASDLPVTPAAFHESWLYAVMNPHADVLARVFALAGVEYGRVDYLVTREGRVRVWEINTNPHVSSLSAAGDVSRRVIQDAWHRRYEAIMRALDRVVASRPRHRPGWSACAGARSDRDSPTSGCRSSSARSGTRSCERAPLHAGAEADRRRVDGAPARARFDRGSTRKTFGTDAAFVRRLSPRAGTRRARRSAPWHRSQTVCWPRKSARCSSMTASSSSTTP